MSTLFINILIVLVTIIITGFTFCLLAWSLATKDLFFTFMREGQIKVVMKGSEAHLYIGLINGHVVDYRTGDVVRLIKGKIENYRTGEVKDDSDNDYPPRYIDVNGNERTAEPIPRGLFLHKIGIYWIGIPPFYKIHKYSFSWNKWGRGSMNDVELSIVAKGPEIVDSLYYRAAYAVQVSEAETKGRLPVDIYLTIVPEIISTNITLFATPNWLDGVTAAVMAAIRDFVGNMKYADLTKLQHETTSNEGARISSFVGAVVDGLNNATGNGSIATRYGVRLGAVNLVSFKLAGTHADEVERATMQAYMAEQNAIEIITVGKADAKAIELKGAAEATALDQQVRALNGDSRRLVQIRNAQAVERTRITTLVMGGQSGTLLNIPASADNKDDDTSSSTKSVAENMEGKDEEAIEV